MNIKYMLIRCEHQIRNINNKLIKMRKERDLILNEISELENIRDLLKKSRNNFKKQNNK